MDLTKKIKILAVDDEPHITNLLKLSLNSERIEVQACFSGKECLSYVEDYDYNLFIIDICMPVMDGWKLIEKLKTNSKTKNIPIIILSIKGQMNDKLAGVDVGADDYITKPFDPKELEKRVYLNLGIERWKK